MVKFHVAHTLAGRLYIVSDIEAKDGEDALDQMRQGADDDPALIRGARFIMDNRDPMDEYELVHEKFLQQTSDYTVLDPKDLIAAVADLAHLCDVLNSRQHAGLSITPTMWGALYDRCNEAKAILAKIEW